MKLNCLTGSQLHPYNMMVVLFMVSVITLLDSSKQVEAATRAPTGTPTFAPKPYDPTVGTALAPTTPGGACLNQADYFGIWRKENADKKTGFDLFPGDLQLCSERCSYLLAFDLPQSPEYDCGAFGQAGCGPFIYARCVADCMARDSRLTSQPDFPALKTNPSYSPPCTSCMGNVSLCVTEVCFSECALGGNSNLQCQLCAEEKCNPDFEQCSGLNIDAPQRAPATDFTPIILGAIGGGAGLLLAVGFVGYRHRVKTRKLREMSPKELEAMAKMQSNNSTGGQNFNSGLFGATSSQIGMRNVPIERKGNMVGFRSSVGSDNPLVQQRKVSGSSLGTDKDGLSPLQQLSPYQVQYDAQQRAMVNSTPHPRPSPSARMSLMASQPVPTHLLGGGGTPLVMLWTFNAERPDELTCQVGQKIIGLEQADGWWLAMTEDRQVGLIPVNYAAHDPAGFVSRKPTPSRNIPPSARMSKMHASMASSPSVKILQMPSTALIAIFDFEAQRADEIAVSVGTIVLGIHEQDGWWLVRTEDGNRIGLIPSNFLEKVMISTPGFSFQSSTLRAGTASLQNPKAFIESPAPTSSEPNF